MAGLQRTSLLPKLSAKKYLKILLLTTFNAGECIQVEVAYLNSIKIKFKRTYLGHYEDVDTSWSKLPKFVVMDGVVYSGHLSQRLSLK